MQRNNPENDVQDGLRRAPHQHNHPARVKSPNPTKVPQRGGFGGTVLSGVLISAGRGLRKNTPD